jgi:tetratricopeptide (TPR) repeat protein
VLCGRAEALCRLDRGDAAIAPAAEALEIFGTLGRRREAALATYWLAYAQYLAENRAEARSLLSGLLTDLRATEDTDPDLRLRVLMALSSVESTDDDHRSALAYLEEARVLATDLDDWRRGAFLSMLAASYSQVGDLEGAIRSGAESLALFRSAEAQRETAILENNLAVAYLRIGNVSRAREMAAHARVRHESEGDRRSLAHVAETEAQIALTEERYPDAIALAGEAIEHAEASGNPRAMTSALVTIARAEAGDGRPDDAIETYRRATELTREVGPVHRLQQVLGEWAELLAVQGRHEEAYSLSREALQSVTVPLIDARPLGASKTPGAGRPMGEPATASELLDDVKPTPVAG